MRSYSLYRTANTWKRVLIVLAVLASLVAGGSLLLHDSPWSPLVVAGVVGGAVLSIVCLRKPVWMLYVAVFVALLPTGLLPSSMQSFLNRATLVLGLGLWSLDAAIQKRRIVWTDTTLLMGAFVVWGLVTLAWAPNVDRGIEALFPYIARVFLFLVLVVNEVNTIEALDGLMKALAIGGWLLIAVGVGISLAQGYQGGILRILAMNQNEIAIKLLVAFPGVFWQVMRATPRQRSLKMVQSVLFMLFALGFVGLSGSRGGAIALGAVLLVLWFSRPTRAWGRLGLLILVAAVIGAPFLLDPVIERFAQVEGGMLGGRILLWQVGAQLISRHFWGGVGIGNAGAILMANPGPLVEYVRYVRAEGQTLSLHNPVLEIWAETGILGLLLYMGALGSAMWSFVWYYLYHKRQELQRLIPYFALTACMFVGVILTWIKGGGMEQDPTFFLLLALLNLPARLVVRESDLQDKAGTQTAA